jgi:hypothetical protein
VTKPGGPLLAGGGGQEVASLSGVAAILLVRVAGSGSHPRVVLASSSSLGNECFKKVGWRDTGIVLRRKKMNCLIYKFFRKSKEIGGDARKQKRAECATKWEGKNRICLKIENGEEERL